MSSIFGIKVSRLLSVSALLMVFGMTNANAATGGLIDVQTLNQKLKETHAGWVAKDTPISHLSKAEAKRMMGYNRPVSEGVDFVNVIGFSRANLPAVLDWRNKDGVNWISPILNQANCGSCVAFAAVGVLESMVNIATLIPSSNVHLSAQHLFSCGGGMCDFGWAPAGAANFIQNTGVPDEACMPYTSGATGQDVACSATCADTGSRTVKIAGYTTPSRMVRDVEAVKQALQNGPLVTTLSVYTDFMSYASGVYKHSTGEVLGGHAISIVGYDDTKQAFIIRNSWGHEWGEEGFGYVAYDDISGVGEETWGYQMPTYKGAVAMETPIDYTYATQHLPVKATSTFAGTASMSIVLLSGSNAVATGSCQAACDTDLNLASVADGRYDLQINALDGAGKVLGSSVRHIVYVANTQPKIDVTFKAKDFDITKPLKARVEFNITTTTSSVPLSSIEFHFRGADGVVHTKSAAIVLSEMSIGWRTNVFPNGTYDIWMVGHLDTNGFKTLVETPHVTVTTNN